MKTSFLWYFLVVFFIFILLKIKFDFSLNCPSYFISSFYFLFGYVIGFKYFSLLLLIENDYVNIVVVALPVTYRLYPL